MQGIKIVIEICLAIVIMGVIEVVALIYLFSHKDKETHTREYGKEQRATNGG